MMEGDMLRLFRFFDSKEWIIETEEGVKDMLGSILGDSENIRHFTEKCILQVSEFQASQEKKKNPRPGENGKS